MKSLTCAKKSEKITGGTSFPSLFSTAISDNISCVKQSQTLFKSTLIIYTTMLIINQSGNNIIPSVDDVRFQFSACFACLFWIVDIVYFLDQSHIIYPAVCFI